MLKGIVFDLDGTLVDSLSVTFDAFNHAILSLGGLKHTPQEIMRHFGVGEPEIFAKILGTDKAEAAYEASKTYMGQSLGQVPLHPGVEDLLEKLKSAGVPLAIFTGRSWDTTEIILKHHHLLDRFITVVCHDHVSQAKPSPEGLFMALGRMKIEASECLYVGDSWQDIRLAHAAGSQAVAALWDLLVDRKTLAAQEPQYFAERPIEVLDIWENAKII
jgi:HAD superfamily hydrolase (TIGR01549 family)